MNQGLPKDYTSDAYLGDNTGRSVGRWWWANWIFNPKQRSTVYNPRRQRRGLPTLKVWRYWFFCLSSGNLPKVTLDIEMIHPMTRTPPPPPVVSLCPLSWPLFNLSEGIPPKDFSPEQNVTTVREMSFMVPKFNCLFFFYRMNWLALPLLHSVPHKTIDTIVVTRRIIPPKWWTELFDSTSFPWRISLKIWIVKWCQHWLWTVAEWFAPR